MSNERRVVVTGLGATTPVGGTVPETWDAILAGRSGARTLDNDWAERYELPVTFGAQIHTPASEVLSKVEVRRMDPNAQYALIASREAWEDAGSPEVEPERLGVAIGTGIGGVWTLLDQWDTLRERGRAECSRWRCRCSCPTARAATSPWLWGHGRGPTRRCRRARREPRRWASPPR